MEQYVALIADQTGRYGWVYVKANNWDTAVDQLEDLGCEVVENQSVDYDFKDLQTKEDRLEVDVVDIADLIKQTDFVPCG
jgi:anaerobic ribonucleoside-triphosphate reductase